MPLPAFAAAFAELRANGKIARHVRQAKTLMVEI
jgi:hypothetical protein